ncbi:MAG: hypothetical protein GY765_36235 [bacterium]|nr:hypothetical protein [bacterium]
MAEANDKQLLNQLEAALNTELTQVDPNQINQPGNNGVCLDQNNHVVGLNLDDFTIEPKVYQLISGFTDLRFLNARNLLLENITPFQKLTNLIKLDLGANQIIDLTPLKNLVHLEILLLDDN